MCPFFFPDALDSAFIQLPEGINIYREGLINVPSAESDWLIFIASFKVFPVAPVFPTFSLPDERQTYLKYIIYLWLPARSARYNFPIFSVPSELFCAENLLVCRILT